MRRKGEKPFTLRIGYVQECGVREGFKGKGVGIVSNPHSGAHMNTETGFACCNHSSCSHRL